MNNLRLAEIFQDRMVLQREQPIAVFGKGLPFLEFKVELVDCDNHVTAEAKGCVNADSDFLVYLPKQEASLGNSVKIICMENTEAVLSDVAIGDVWLAGGQSNMEFFNKYDKDWETTKDLPKNEKIRLYNVPQRAFEGHDTHNRLTRGGYGKWLSDGEAGYENFSAPAYSFARNIQEKTGVTIGLIGCNWGGTTASAWVNLKVLSEEPLNQYLLEYREETEGIDPIQLKEESLLGWETEDKDANYRAFEELLYGRDESWQKEFMERTADQPQIPMGPYNINRPGGLYKTMLKTIIPYSLKGVLWYQGESDAGDRAFMYDKLLTGLIDSWRREWNNNMPFFLVQLAPFGKWLDCGNENYRIVREMQEKVADSTEGVYLVGIMDLGNYYDIHPKEKKEVGRRLALSALKNVYGLSEYGDAPRAVCASRQDKSIRILIRNAEGLYAAKEENDCRILCGGERFEPEKIRVEEDALILELGRDVPPDKALEIQFGYEDYARINLMNQEGLSLLPFHMTV